MDTTLLITELNSAKSPAVLWSGGKDSTLLLLTARRLGYDLPAVWFRTADDYEPAIMQMVHELGVTLYSWQPANLYLLAYNGSTALVREFSVNGELLPVLTNVHADPTGQCLARTPRTPSLYLPFDLLLTGYKDCDTHWAAEGTLLYPEGLVVGGIKLVAPLRHLTDVQVLAELSALAPNFTERNDEVAICADCVAGKPLHWDRPLDLTTFHRRVKL